MDARKTMPWQEFFEWLVAGIKELEPLSYKGIPWSARGWRRWLRAKLPKNSHPSWLSGPPYLTTAKGETAKKLLTAYLVTASLDGNRRTHTRYLKNAMDDRKSAKGEAAKKPLTTDRKSAVEEKTARENVDLAEEAALKTRIWWFRGKLRQSKVTEACVVEEQFAEFRFAKFRDDPYGIQPGEVVEPNVPWNRPTGKSLSQFERTEIATLCHRGQLPQMKLRGRARAGNTARGRGGG